MQFSGRRTTLASLLVAASCAAGETIGEAERAEIERLLVTYRSAMVEAYRRGDPAALAEVASERERARVGNAIATVGAEGTALRPTFVRASLHSIERAGRTAWTVAVDEVWDLRTVALGTEQPVAESLGQENRVLYTMIREDGRWWVLTRLLSSSSAGT